jgi:hypothetical protein
MKKDPWKIEPAVQRIVFSFSSPFPSTSDASGRFPTFSLACHRDSPLPYRWTPRRKNTLVWFHVTARSRSSNLMQVCGSSEIVSCVQRGAHPKLTVSLMHICSGECRLAAGAHSADFPSQIVQASWIGDGRCAAVRVENWGSYATRPRSRYVLGIMRWFITSVDMMPFVSQFQHHITATSVEQAHKRLAVARVVVNNDFQEQPSACPNWFVAGDGSSFRG